MFDIFTWVDGLRFQLFSHEEFEKEWGKTPVGTGIVEELDAGERSGYLVRDSENLELENRVFTPKTLFFIVKWQN
jgi:hypothetical protein